MGLFRVDDVLRDSKIALQKAATDQFGSVVDTFARGSMDRLLGVEPTGEVDTRSNRPPHTWNSVDYATALSGTDVQVHNYRPKLKFLFKVQFNFTDKAKKAFPKIFDGKTSNDFTFMVKTVDRPKIEFEYEDDVNMYNFRTKVLRRIKHQELTLEVMDDTGNRVFEFFRSLLAVHSPISSGGMARDGTLDPPVSMNLLNGSGMSWVPFPLGVAGQNNAHRAIVNSTFGNSIDSIRILQVFTDPSETLPRAAKAVSFDFINPRITRFDLDELSHESSDPNNLTMTFDYDWMEMVDIGVLGTARTSDAKLQQNPLGDFESYSVATPNVAGSAKPNSNPILDALTKNLGGIANNTVKKFSSDLVGKAITTIAGNGALSSRIGSKLNSSFSKALNNAVNRAVGGSDGIGGLVQQGASDLVNRGASYIGQVGSTFASNLSARAHAPVVKDSDVAFEPSTSMAYSQSYAEYAGKNPAPTQGQ